MTLLSTILTLKGSSQRLQGADFSRYGVTPSKIGSSERSRKSLQQPSHPSW